MKKISQMVLGILLVVLSLSVTPKAAFAEHKTVTKIEVGNKTAFDDAISKVNSASEGEYVISLTGDVEISGALDHIRIVDRKTADDEDSFFREHREALLDEFGNMMEE